MSLKCEACGITFATEREFKDHSRNHMGGGPAPREFRCSACGGVFPSEADLKRHSEQGHNM